MEPRGRLHTENDPYLEFAVSRTTMHDLTNTLSLIRLYRKHAASLLPDNGRSKRLHGDIERMGRATGHVLNAMVMSSARNPGHMIEIRNALAIVPDYPGISTRSDGILMAPPEKDVREKTPSHSSLVVRARELLREGAYAEMIAPLKQALEIEPRSGEALTLLGETYLKMGRFDEALIYLKQAIDYGTDIFEAHYHLGWIHLRKGNLDAARGEFLKGIRANPNAAELHYALGMTYKFQNNLPDALRSLNRALDLTPFDAEINFTLGLIHEAQGDRFTALQFYRKALRLEPGHEGARQGLARLN